MKKRNIVVLAIVMAIIAAGIVGWLIGRSNNSTYNKQLTSTQNQTISSTSGSDVKALVSYTLPDGWGEGTCSSSGNSIYVSPDDTTLNCSTNPSAPIKIFLDTQDTTDCQQLAPTSNEGIRKHVCISLYISGHKSLKASTEYSNGSSYKTDTTINSYYINTGKGVIVIQYTYTTSNDFQAGFDQLAMSVKANN